jgi:hypothetical protein
MPSFGVYAAKLAAGLASGVEQPAEPAPSPEMVEAGRVLVTKQKGFGCTDCHALGDQPAQAVFEAEGVNLAFTRERLRLDYFRSWMHDPTRLDPATKMPRFADEHGMTLISELLDGNGERQFEAIRQYLATLTPPKQNIAGQRGNAPADYTHMTDANWLDNRFQKMVERERVMSTTVKLPGEKAAYKGVVMRVGDHDEATVCFDTATLKMRAAWTGGFLDVGPRRFSLTEIPTPHGQMLWVTPANTPGWTHDGSFADPRKTEYEVLPHDHGVFEGYYIHDQRVVLKYRVGGVEVLESPWAEKRGEKLVITRDLVIAPSKDVMQLSMPSKVTVAAQVRGGGVSTSTDEKGNVSIGIEPHDEPVAIKLVIGGGFSPTAVAPLKTWTTGGTSRLGEPLTTRGVVGRSNGPFEVDTVTVPYENPFDALFFTAGHDFFDDGRAAVCTAHGDVWLVSGIDGSLDQVKWKRFATGLFQPLGLKIVDGKVFVICRDGLVRLHDLNGDGEADYYERFNNDLQVTTSGHSFATCLETDTDGNFYFVKCGDPGAHAGCVLKVSRDGSKLEIVATGLRNPNGMGMGPGNLLTEADNQGNWVPESRVDIIKPGGFYGFVPNSHRSEEPKSYDGPLCWVPRVLDNSSGGQVWVPTGSWGPLGGQMLHLSYGRARMMMILRDYVDGVDQGATVSLPGRFLSGAMRGRFNPRDGHLYVSGLNGWQTAAVRDGCFQRVRYTGKPLYLPIAWAVKHDAIELTFTQKLDKATAEDAANYAAEQWNYLWSKGYGSKDWSPSNPSAEGRDPVTIKSAKLLEDGKTVRLEMPGLTPVMQMRISYNVDAADGAVVKGELYPTINRVPAH